jgi:hypothetical protein
MSAYDPKRTCGPSGMERHPDSNDGASVITLLLTTESEMRRPSQGSRSWWPSSVVHDIPDNELGSLNHKLPKLGVFFHECMDVSFLNVRPER